MSLTTHLVNGYPPFHDLNSALHYEQFAHAHVQCHREGNMTINVLCGYPEVGENYTPGRGKIVPRNLNN